MISYGLDREEAILYLYPSGAMADVDYAPIRQTVDRFLEGAQRRLLGVIIVLRDPAQQAQLVETLHRLYFAGTAQHELTRVAVVGEGSEDDEPSLEASLRERFDQADLLRLPAGGELEARRRMLA